MNEHTAKVADSVAFVVVMGGFMYVLCKMVDKFGKKPN